MEGYRYTVILRYDPDDLETHHKVIAGLMRLNPKAAKRFGKEKTGRIIIKRNVDMETAGRLKQIFHDTGAQCDIRKMLPPSADSDHPPSKSTDQSEKSSRPSTSLLITCPNCSHQQPQDVECRACGIILSKARARRESSNLPVSPISEPTTKPGIKTSSSHMATRISRLVTDAIENIHHHIGIDKLSGWAGGVADRLIRCGIAFVIALLLEIGFAIALKMSWFLYTETITGKYFIETHPEQAEVFQHLTAIDPLSLGWDITLSVLWLGLLIGCAAQFLHLVRYLFESQHLIGKLVIWFAPFIAFAAWDLGQREPYPEIVLSSTMVAVPALCLLPSCLRLSQAMLPQIGDIISLLAIIMNNRGETWGQTIKKIRKWFDAVKQ